MGRRLEGRSNKPRKIQLWIKLFYIIILLCFHMISICDRILIFQKSEQLWPSSAWVNSESHGGEDVAVYAEGPWVGSFFE